MITKEIVWQFLLLTLWSLLVYGAARVFYFIWWKPKWLERQLKQQGIRGTTYKLMIGDMKELIRLMTETWSKPITLGHQIVARVDPFTLNNVKTYGKISLCWFGSTPRLVLKDPELIKQVLSNKSGHFHKPPLNPLILILTKGLTVQKGENWVRHRTIINPAFHLDKLKGMISVFASSCNSMIAQWKKEMSPDGTCEMDVLPEFKKLTADIISKAAFASNYEEGKKIFELQKELILLVMEAMQTLYIPGFRFVPTKKNRRRKTLDKKINLMLRNLIQRKENAMRNGESKMDDLLGLLLQSNESEMRDNRMTIEEVIEECKQFYLAGQETTSSLLTWTIVVLAMHPDWQEKAREEILQVCENKELNFEALSHLKTVTMILYEVLRLYPPVIALYQHAYKKTKIGDFSVPAGVDLTLPTLLIHHDPELWGDDAEEFKPNRFSEGISKAAKDQLAFFPFGWGPRTCIGQNFSMIEAKLTLAVILRHFSFELSPTYTHAPYTVMTLEPQHGAPIILHPL